MSKSTDTKLEFIKARAAGKSYRTIAKELDISPSTCYEWQKDLKADIDRLTRERVAEVYEAQSLNKAARLEAIGVHRKKIIEALEQKDYTEVPADKLADMLLKADRAIAEYVDQEQTEQTYTDYFTELNTLYMEAKNGKLNPADIKARLELITRIDSGRGGLDFDIDLLPKEIPEEEYYTDETLGLADLYEAITNGEKPEALDAEKLARSRAKTAATQPTTPAE